MTPTVNKQHTYVVAHRTDVWQKADRVEAVFPPSAQDTIPTLSPSPAEGDSFCQSLRKYPKVPNAGGRVGGCTFRELEEAVRTSEEARTID